MAYAYLVGASRVADRADGAQAIQKAEPEHEQHRPPLEHIDGAAERGFLLDALNVAMIAEPAAESIGLP